MRCSGSFFLFPKCDIVKNIVAYVKPFQLIFVYIGENTHIERKGFVMDDTQIVDLYFARSEIAIKETDIKYGGYCYKIAYGILANREDSEESVSDTYLSAWNCIPPRRPARLSTFLGKLTRNIAIDRWRKGNAKKRGSEKRTLRWRSWAMRLRSTQCRGGSPAQRGDCQPEPFSVRAAK